MSKDDETSKDKGLEVELDLMGIKENFQKLRDKQSELMEAVKKGDVSKVKNLLDEGVSANVRNPSGEVALVEAASRLKDDKTGKFEETIKLLINGGADVNQIRKKTSSPPRQKPNMYAPPSKRLLSESRAIHHAAEAGNIAIVGLLCDKGADVEVECYPEKKTPLMLAKDPDVVELLILKDAKVDTRNRKGRTALYDAFDQRNFAKAEVLIRAGANLGIKDGKGVTPEDLFFDNYVRPRLIKNYLGEFLGEPKPDHEKRVPAITICQEFSDGSPRQIIR